MDGKRIRVHTEKHKTAAQANAEKQKYTSAISRTGSAQTADPLEFSDAGGRKTPLS